MYQTLSQTALNFHWYCTSFCKKHNFNSSRFSTKVFIIFKRRKNVYRFFSAVICFSKAWKVMTYKVNIIHSTQIKSVHGPELKRKLQNAFDHIWTQIGRNLFSILTLIANKASIWSRIEKKLQSAFDHFQTRFRPSIFGIFFFKRANWNTPKTH